MNGWKSEEIQKEEGCHKQEKKQEEKEKDVLMLSLMALFFILIFSLRLKGADRVAGFSFAALFIAHELLLIGISAPWYCASDAVIACFLATSLAAFNYSKFIIKIMVVCIVAIVLDFTGLVMWNLELPVETVDCCFYVLYLYTGGITIRGKTNGGTSGLGSMDSVFRFLIHSSRYNREKVLYEARN